MSDVIDELKETSSDVLDYRRGYNETGCALSHEMRKRERTRRDASGGRLLTVLSLCRTETQKATRLMDLLKNLAGDHTRGVTATRPDDIWPQGNSATVIQPFGKQCMGLKKARNRAKYYHLLHLRSRRTLAYVPSRQASVMN